MLRLKHPRVALALAPLLGLILLPSIARAGLPLVVDASASMDGLREYSEVTVKKGGKLRVKPLGDGVGWLHLRANRITVEEGGLIDATGAGYQGKDGGDGGQPANSSAGGKVSQVVGEPGTGGANAGAGGQSADDGCKLFDALPGGAAYASFSVLELGAAGGAANVSNPALVSRGGHGGGRIILEAAQIAIAGAVEARGTDGLNPNGVASGGGAGGSIQIIAGELTGAGTLAVTGGQGGLGLKNNGGGGGGGVIALVTPTPVSTLGLDIEGGAGGACDSTGAGGEGQVIEAQGAACPDSDKDLVTAAICGGQDCDDADSAIHPVSADQESNETCDGQDNDCDTIVDNRLRSGACPAGTSCKAGACTEDGSGVGSGGGALSDPGPRPDHIAYKGGCSVFPGDEAWGFAALAAASLALHARRRMR